MKEATNAPAFAVMYAGLCDIARNCGYALSIHGSLDSDLDLIAVPWIEDAKPSEILVNIIKDRLNANLGVDFDTDNPSIKPHGRVAYNLYLSPFSKVDLSIVNGV